jgi:signal peptidase I
MKKHMRWISNIGYGLVMITLLVMIAMVISSRASGGEPELFGHQIKTVLSGSMEPTFKTGSVIVVEKLTNTKNLKKDDVITFKKDEKNIVTHRIIEVVKQGDNVFYRTKGDNNESPDMEPVLSQNVVALYSGYTIPLIGYFLKYASSPIGTAILLIVPGLLLLAYAAWTIRLAIKEIEGKVKNTVKNEPAEKVVS